MIFQRNTDCLGNRIQLKTIQRRKQKSRHTNRIHIGKIMLNSLPVTVFHNKSHIEIRIVRNHDRALTKFQKLRKHFLDRRCPHNHAVINAGQLFNTERNRNFRIDKCGKTIRNLPVFHQNRTDFNNLTCQR